MFLELDKNGSEQNQRWYVFGSNPSVTVLRLFWSMNELTALAVPQKTLSTSLPLHYWRIFFPWRKKGLNWIEPIEGTDGWRRIEEPPLSFLFLRTHDWREGEREGPHAEFCSRHKICWRTYILAASWIAPWPETFCCCIRYKGEKLSKMFTYVMQYE